MIHQLCEVGCGGFRIVKVDRVVGDIRFMQADQMGRRTEPKVGFLSFSNRLDLVDYYRYRYPATQDKKAFE